MSLRGRTAGLRSRRRSGGQTMIDLTPLIDIVFQLLIFFLLTATFQTNPAFRVKLPKAKNTDVTQEPKAVVVTISAAGEFQVDGKPVDSRELELRLCAAVKEDPATGVSVRADGSTQHRYTVEVYGLAKSCGMERLNIVHAR